MAGDNVICCHLFNWEEIFVRTERQNMYITSSVRSSFCGSENVEQVLMSLQEIPGTLKFLATPWFRYDMIMTQIFLLICLSFLR